MRYWAIARALGLSEQEFWASSYARIATLYRVVVLEWQRRRDYFPANLIAMKASSERMTYTPDDILNYHYPLLPVESKHDPDLGAAGSWRKLKDAMKGSGRKGKHASR